MLGGTSGRARPPWPPLELPHPPPAHQPPPADGFGRYGVYSLFPGGDVYAAPRYNHTQPVPAPTQYHGLLPPTPHKECVFSAFTGAPGSPYSTPVVERGISQLQELMAKGAATAGAAVGTAVEKKAGGRLVEAAPASVQPSPQERRPKRRAWDSTPITLADNVKQENGRPSCACRAKTPTTVLTGPSSPGCSRTTPVTLKPQPHVKREPACTPAPAPTLAVTPCQVSEITTSTVKVKQEIPDPSPTIVSAGSQQQGGIPVGIAVARQRSQEVRVKEDPVMPPLAPIEQNLPVQPPMGYQLVRDPVSGQLLLISTGNNIAADSLQRTLVWPNNTTGFPSSPLLLPQPQPMAGHLLLDRLVTLATPTPPPPPTMDKRRQPTHNLLKIEEPSLTGVMPCAKSSVVIQQLSTHSGPAPLLNPQFSAIASSGSVLIQHISGSNSVQPTTLLPPQNQSVLISAQQLTTEAQSLINGQPLANSPSVVISHSQQDSTATVISPHVIGQLSSAAELLGSHTQQLPLVISGEQFLTQQQPQIHLQIKESPKEEIQEVPEAIENQIEEKIEVTQNGCRSQATSPVACLSPLGPGVDCHSQSQSEDETLQPPAVQQQDASNQTDSLPPSDEETMPEEAEVVDAYKQQPVQTEAVDLSGLELLSAASIKQIERSHSAPLIDPPKIKIEIEEEPTEEPPPPIVIPAPIQIVIKEEKDLVDEITPNVEETPAAIEEDGKAGINMPMAETESSLGGISALGMLCDVADRIREEEKAAASKPQSPATSRSHSPAVLRPLMASRSQSPVTSRPHSCTASRPQSPDDLDKHRGWDTDELTSPEINIPQRKSSNLLQPCSESAEDLSEYLVRVKMAEIQRLYRENKRKLIKLTPRKSFSSDTSSSSTDPSLGSKRGPGRPRKDSSVKKYGEPGDEKESCSISRGVKRGRSVSPPVSPPVLEAWSEVKCHENLTPPTLTPHKSALAKERSCSDQQVEWELVSPGKSPPPLSPAESPSSASKKRKVGRPKKRIDPDSVTIVAKKPRSKSSLVGLLLAKKQLPSTPDSHKIKPKLKAEVKVKSWCEEDERDIEWTSMPMRRHSVPPVSPSPLATSTPIAAPAPAKPVKSRSLPTPTHKPTPNKKPVMVLASRKRTVSTDQPSVPQPRHVEGVADCTLFSNHLKDTNLPCRVLVAMGGLFYAGQLSEVRPPDLYGVTLDGERSNRQHIHPREEILKDFILETCMDTVPPPGTRVCAYWSQQYRCLYPGTVPVPSADDMSDAADSRFVCVEFDDGDNGRIALEDVRLLPQNYPVVEYDPNPLQSLGKRRRRISGASCDSHSKEKTPQVLETVAEEEPEVSREDAMETSEEPPSESVSTEEQTRFYVRLNPDQPDTAAAEPAEPQTQTQLDVAQLTAEAAERERRRLKKKRKEKLRRMEGEKKHRHKHKDCLKSHKHKHKHRHHRHKHRHSKLSGGVVMENGLVEEKKPLTLVVKSPNTPSLSSAVPTSPPILSTIKIKKGKKGRERQGSVESRSKMAAFLPERQLWRWAGSSYKRPGAKGRARKDFYKSIQRGNETISVGDCAVFLSTGRPDRPYIGRIESMWESWGSSMVVKVKWFYHPEETVGCPEHLPYPGALFESPHNDENDVQTISHKCEVLPLQAYAYRLKLEPHRLATIYDYNDIYYLAGHYDPTNTSLRFEPGINDS